MALELLNDSKLNPCVVGPFAHTRLQTLGFVDFLASPSHIYQVANDGTFTVQVQDIFHGLWFDRQFILLLCCISIHRTI